MPEGPTLLVVNPATVRVRRAELLRDIEATRRSGQAEVLMTERPDHAREFCADHAGRFAKIIVAGGDGLLNEVVDGSHRTLTANGSTARPVIAPLPAGSGNDYVKALPGYPATLAELLAANESVPADAGLVTFSDGSARWFLSEAGAGMDAACVRLMPAWLTRLKPAASYSLGAIRAIVQYRPFAATVTLDGTSHDCERVHMLAVANTTYFGDGMRLAPDARFDDGRFHVVVVKDAWKPELLLRFRMIRKGTHVTHRKIIYAPCRRIEVVPDRPLEMCIDGDHVPKTPARFEILPGAVAIVRPESRAASPDS